MVKLGKFCPSSVLYYIYVCIKVKYYGKSYVKENFQGFFMNYKSFPNKCSVDS